MCDKSAAAAATTTEDNLILEDTRAQTMIQLLFWAREASSAIWRQQLGSNFLSSLNADLQTTSNCVPFGSRPLKSLGGASPGPQLT